MTQTRPLERRPIRSRETRWAEVVAERLVRSGISPNAISVFGMIAAVGAGAAFVATSQVDDGFGRRGLWLLGGLLCQVRLLCNLFDGMVAIARNTASATGELYNEVPDRVSDAAVFIGLGYCAVGRPELGFLAALIAVFVAYVRAMAKSLGAPNDFCGPMAKPQRMAIATVFAAAMSLWPNAWSVASYDRMMFDIALGLVVAGGIATAVRRLRRATKFLSGADR